jgi:hypothetical protein
LIYRERIQMLCVPFFFLNKGKNCWRRGKRCSFLEDRCVSVEWYVFFFFVTAWNYKKLNIHMRVNRKIDKKQQCALFVWFDCFLERECKLFFWKRTDCDGQCAFIFCLFSFILQCVFFSITSKILEWDSKFLTKTVVFYFYKFLMWCILREAQ